MGGDTEWTVSADGSDDVDAAALERDLRRRIRGEVRFDSATRATYSTDASNYRNVPTGVVLPVDVDDVVEAVAACRRHGAPIVHRGGGTSLAGQTANAAVVIDTSKHVNRILEIDPRRRIARVQPGVRHDQLNKEARKHGLVFGPDPSTHEYCTFGGMIGNNACGIHSELAGRTVDNVEELEILTYDGRRMRVGRADDEEFERILAAGGPKAEVYRRLRGLRDRYADLIRERYPNIPRRVSGYNLDELLPENGFNVARSLVGTEGTCVTVLEATVRLIEDPRHKTMVVLGYHDVVTAGHHVAEIKQFEPIAIEGMDSVLLQDMKLKNIHKEEIVMLPDGGGWLIVEFGGDSKGEADERAQKLVEHVREGDDSPSVVVLRSIEEQQQLWEVRESGLGATARVPNQGDTWPGWEDSAVPPEKLGHYMRELRELYDRFDYKGALYGHFGQGCVHTRINFDLRSRPGIEKFRRFIDEASDLCIRYGGSFSAEHGDGQARGELLPKMYGEELVEAFREFKQIWDPTWKMNPGKVVNPRRIDEDLRLGENYDPPDLDTVFQFPDDDGSFSRAALRCVGVGKCRRKEIGAEDVMCPSYLATDEEMHTTRGRARLLFEMLNGNETPDAWDNDDVHEALDLCLSCKGCKNDCPVNVDMATYKAEFLHHYYKNKLRPRHAFAFGLIFLWARLGSKMPQVANFLTQTPGLDRVSKFVADMAPERKVPRFPEQTFRKWFKERGGTRNPDGEPRVMLWPDTFNNYFKPDTAKAAVAVLESAGCQVVLPPRPLCCGRPLYDYGMLNLGVHLWKQILTTLQHEIRAGTPLVGLEPSCVAAFRDELVNLFPNDWDANRLSQQTFTFSEYLSDHLPKYQPPTLRRKALVHGHCQHKSIMGMKSEQRLLDKTQLDYEVVAAGCCGMAGAFGFESDHYDVSIKAGEYALLPRVRSASKDTLIIADGFSCREQIQQTTDRHALHTAEVLHMAGGPDEKAGYYPEEPYVKGMRFEKERMKSRRKRWLAAAGAVVTGGLATWLMSR